MPKAAQTASLADALDADLARLIAAWPTLPDDARQAIMALVGKT